MVSSELPDFSHIIGGSEVRGKGKAQTVESIDPYTGEPFWASDPAGEDEIERALAAARAAQPSWARKSYEERLELVRGFTELVKAEAESLSRTIASEAGKPLWESLIEVNAVVGKLAASDEAYRDRAREIERTVRGAKSRTRYMPHGVLVVLSPFNFPASMGNSHLMPAVLAGNTVVLKPSELTPLTGLRLGKLWQEAGLPPGVVNVLTGDGETGRRLVGHANHDGVLFVGGVAGGNAIRQQLSSKPDKILALELGGNSPLVIWDYEDVEAVLHLIIQSTFLSGGQRCSAARRLLIRQTDHDLTSLLKDRLASVRIGHYRDTPEPYYGPLIRASHAERVTEQVKDLVANGAREVLKGTMSGPGAALMSPILLDMANSKTDHDEEIFGPVLKIYRYDSLDEAIRIANQTNYGLAAGMVCTNRDVFERFFRDVRAGIINWNQQLTGATTFAPFGGIKGSGNFRSAGYHSVDYCTYPTASFEVDSPRIPEAVSPGLPF